MENNESPITTLVVCSILAMEQSCFSYKVCACCETPLPDSSPPQFICTSGKCASRPRTSKHLFRVLFSIGTDTRVINVVAFDRAARVIFGCSAQEFLDYSVLHPLAVKQASEVMMGEMFKVTLNEPKRGKADHLRMTNVVPMSSRFMPVIQILKLLDETESKDA